MKVFSVMTAAIFAVRGAVWVLAQEVPTDPASQYALNIFTQLGTSSVIIFILLKLRKDDEARHQLNRDSDREEKKLLMEKLFSLVGVSTAVAQTGTEISEHRRQKSTDVNEAVLERLEQMDELLSEIKSGRDKRKS